MVDGRSDVACIMFDIQATIIRREFFSRVVMDWVYKRALHLVYIRYPIRMGIEGVVGIYDEVHT